MMFPRSHSRRSLTALPMLLVGLATLSPARAAAQDRRVAGSVVTRSQTPVGGATVTIPGTQARATTDVRGQFRLALPPGTRDTVRLRVTMVGYRPQEQTVSASDQEVRFSLAESAVELAEIVVTGTVGEVTKRSLGNAVARVRISISSS